MKINDRLIIPLDVENIRRAEALVDELGGTITTYKVGLQLFTKEGPKVVKMLRRKGKKVFLDLKFHDIPNTVMNAVRSAFELEVDMMTIHAMGGFEMMEAVAKMLWQMKNNGHKPPLIFAVTVLTSLDSAFLEDVIGATNRTMDDEVVILARAAQSAGISGVVASPQEIKRIRKECGSELLILTPGIRPAGSSKDDQSRTATPGSAIADGADYLVVGRPITGSDNRVKAAKQVLKEMKEGING